MAGFIQSGVYLYEHPTLCVCREPGLGPKWCHSCAPPQSCMDCGTDFIWGEEVHLRRVWKIGDVIVDDVYEEVCAKCAGG